MSNQEPVQSATAEFRERLAELQHDIEALARSAKTVARDELSDVGERASTFCQQQAANVRGVERSMEHWIAERPVKSLLTAMGLGVVLGVLWRWR